MDLEAARESRLERIWYACRRVWMKRNRTGLQNRPILRNYILWFACILVLLLVREMSVEPPEEVRPDPVEPGRVRTTTTIPASFSPSFPMDFFPNLATTFFPGSEDPGAVQEAEDASLCPRSDPDAATAPKPHVMALFEELRSLQELRSDRTRHLELSNTVSVAASPHELNVPRRTRQQQNLGMQLRRVQEQIHLDLSKHDELCLAGVHVGVPIRLIVLESQGTLLNPVLVSASDATHTRLEATAFEPEILKQKTRSFEVSIQYLDLEYASHTKTFSNIDAQCILHLLDAMNAVPF